MSLLTTLSLSTEKVFNSALGNVIKEGKYKGLVVGAQELIEAAKLKGWKVSETNRRNLDKLNGSSQSLTPEFVKTLDLMMAEYYINKYQQCITRGISFELSLSDMKKLFSKKTCHYSGERVELPPLHDKRNAWTLDRKDHNLGYTKENVVVCAKWVNGLKNELFEHPDGKYRTDIRTMFKILNKIKGE